MGDVGEGERWEEGRCVPGVPEGVELFRKRLLIPDGLSVSLNRDVGSIQSLHSLARRVGQVWSMPRIADKLWGGVERCPSPGRQPTSWEASR